MDNCTIYGAEYGVTALPGSNISIRNSTFTNCYVGVYVPPSLTGEIQNLNLAVDNCTFNTIGAMPRSFHVPILTHGFAGVSVSDCVLAAIGTDRGNKFVNLNFGIYATGTNLEAYSNSFTNISNYDNVNGGIGINAIGYNYTVLNVKKGNSSLSPPSYFTNCEVGVMSNANTTLVKGCIMNSVGSGILVFGNYLSGVSLQNNYINARTRGIFTTWNFGLTYAKIDENNQISMDGNDHAVGIEIADISLGGEGWNIENNQVAMSKGDVAIAYRSGDRAKIIENSVDMSPLNKNVYTGILVENNSAAKITCNTVTGKEATGFSNNEGIFVRSSPSASISCNMVNNNERGLRSNDLNDNRYTIAGNTIEHHLYGLQVDEFSTIGRQELRGNRWVGPFDNGGAGAVHYGQSKQVENSKFYITGTTCTQLWPCTVLTPNSTGVTWFNGKTGTNFTCTQATVGCAAPGLVQVGDPQLHTDLDDELRTGTYGVGTPFVTQLNWKGKAHYYNLVMNTAVGDRTAVQTAFQAAESTSDIGKLYAAKMALSNAVKGNPATVSQKAVNQIAINNQLADIAATNTALVTSPASVTLLAQKQSQLTALQSLVSSQRTIANTMKTERQAAIQQAKLLNLGITTSVAPATNQKTVNSIVAEVIGTENHNLNTTQISTLQAIATQCPFEGGDAVYEARSILRKALPDVTFDDALTCGIASTRESKEDVGIVSATLYPNPTAEFTTLNYYGTGATQYILYDMLGKQISTSKLSLDNQSEKIYTSNLNAGVYQIALLQENRIIQHLTLSVVK